MRKIVTAVTAAALSLSMLASAVPALAVTGYDSAYAGESAFVPVFGVSEVIVAPVPVPPTVASW